MTTKTQKKTSRIVHFTVSAEFIHEHARRLWSEGEYKKAHSFLGTLTGITERQRCSVIMGRFKFQEVGNSQTFIMTEDDWHPDLNMCHFGQYPDPADKQQMKDAEHVLLKDKVRKGYAMKLHVLLEKTEGIKTAERRLREFALDHSFEEDVLDADFALDWQTLEKDIAALLRVAGMSGYQFVRHASETYYEGDFAAIGGSIAEQNVNAFMQGTRMNYAYEKMSENGVRPEPGDVYENGLIDKDGNFYRCGAQGHNLVAIALGYPSDNSNSEFAALQAALADGCLSVTCNLLIRHIRKGKGGVNDAQRKRLTEWYRLTEYSKAPFFQYDWEDIAPDDKE